jgi:cytochrome c oxidase subunit 3
MSQVVDLPLDGVEKPPELARGGGGPDVPPDGGGGGGGGGDGDGAEIPRDELPISGPKLAMGFVLFSLSVLFLVTTFGALMLRRDAAWHPGAVPAFPPVLWANTVVLLGSSVSLRRAMRSASLARGLALTWILGVVFLVGQSWAWHDLALQNQSLGTGNYATVFHWLTGLHAAHVLGGLVSLGWCSISAGRGLYATHRVGVELCELYWHFLGAVWVVLLTLLFVML